MFNQNRAKNKLDNIEENLWIWVGPDTLSLLTSKDKRCIVSYKLDSLSLAYYPNAIVIHPESVHIRITVMNSCSIEKLVKFYQEQLGMKVC